jgi:ribosomal protein S21
LSARPQKKESFDAMLRQFNREVQASGLLTEIKRRRFFYRKPSKTIRRQEAQRLNKKIMLRRGY